MEKLSQPPASFGVYLGSNDDDTVDAHEAGRKMRVNASPDLDRDGLVKGAEVILNEALNVVEVLDPDARRGHAGRPIAWLGIASSSSAAATRRSSRRCPAPCATRT